MKLAAAHAIASVVGERRAGRGVHHPERVQQVRRRAGGRGRGRGGGAPPAWRRKDATLAARRRLDLPLGLASGSEANASKRLSSDVRQAGRMPADSVSRGDTLVALSAVLAETRRCGTISLSRLNLRRDARSRCSGRVPARGRATWSAAATATLARPSLIACRDVVRRLADSDDRATHPHLRPTRCNHHAGVEAGAPRSGRCLCHRPSIVDSAMFGGARISGRTAACHARRRAPSTASTPSRELPQRSTMPLAGSRRRARDRTESRCGAIRRRRRVVTAYRRCWDGRGVARPGRR